MSRKKIGPVKYEELLKNFQKRAVETYWSKRMQNILENEEITEREKELIAALVLRFLEDLGIETKV